MARHPCACGPVGDDDESMTPHLAPLPGPDQPTVALTAAYDPPTLELASMDLAARNAPYPWAQHDPTCPELRPLPSPAARPRGMRVGDVERDRVCEMLAAHFAAGRLSPAELDDRTSLAVMATTQAELLRLTADLPAMGRAPTAAAPAPAPTWPYDYAHAHPMPMPMRMPAPRHDSGRATVMILWGLMTGAAVLCTMALLFATTAVVGGVVWLAAFGAAVSSSGLTYFITRGAAPAPALPPRR